MALLHRNTDTDWRLIGANDPYWGVLSHDQYRKDVVTKDGLSEFYNSGKIHLEGLDRLVKAHTGTPIRATRALDFGCGVGRVTRAMPAYADTVTGVDISEHMLKKAAEHGHAAISYRSEIPDQAFDWIHSSLVFQHIPPKKGLTILRTLLERLDRGGLITLHFTTDRAAHLKPKSFLDRIIGLSKMHLRPAGSVSMFDYDADTLTQMFSAADIKPLTLFPMTHEHHYAVMAVGRRRVA